MKTKSRQEFSTDCDLYVTPTTTSKKAAAATHVVLHDEHFQLRLLK